MDREKHFPFQKKFLGFLVLLNTVPVIEFKLELDFVKLLVWIGMYKGCMHLWLSPRQAFKGREQKARYLLLVGC